MKASSTYRERAAQNRKFVKRIASPDTSRMPGLAVPDPNITGKYCQFYFKNKELRDKAKKRFIDAKEINPVKS